MEIAILRKIRRKINHADPYNRCLAEIKEAAAIAVNINALQTPAPLEEVPSLVEPILEGTLLEIILWFALEPLGAEDSSNIGNCHFIRRRILRKASVRLSFSSPRLQRHTIVSNEERMAEELVERVLHEGLWESAAGGRWSEYGGNVTTAFSPSTSQRSAFCNNLTKLILIFERRNASDSISQIEYEKETAHISIMNNVQWWVKCICRLFRRERWHCSA